MAFLRIVSTSSWVLLVGRFRFHFEATERGQRRSMDYEKVEFADWYQIASNIRPYF